MNERTSANNHPFGTGTRLQYESTLEKVFLWLIPSTPILVFMLVLFETLYFMPTMMSGDGDLGRHLTVGNLILDTGQIPNRDLFSHTMAGAPLVPKEWLSVLLFALAHRIAGFDGVALLTALILAATFALVTAGLRSMGVRAPVALAGGVLASLVGAIHALPRPHIFTWLMFALFLLILEQYRRNGNLRVLFSLPILMVIWANLHGAFISGLVLVLLYAIGAILEKDRKQLAVMVGLLIVLTLASFINPTGPQLLSHNFGFLQQRFFVDQTVEYQSPNFHLISAWPFAALLVLTMVLGWSGSRRMSWTWLVPLGAWTAFALYSARNIPLFGLLAVFVLAPIADERLGDWLPAVSRRISRLDEIDRLSWGGVWAAVAVVVLAFMQGTGMRPDVWHAGTSFNSKVFPVAAVDALIEKPPEGNMFNEFTWGGYLIYRLWPAKQVFIDGQSDFYGEAFTRDYLQVINTEPGWETTLDHFGVSWVIVPVTSPLAIQIDKSPGWVRRYKDEIAGVWIRR